ncbi:hypothetical protein F5141DRAFT_207568 [Pisolithus sp. B1]|nr:hypothetical protein F5141DRAFT_622551 [Pisolithus sp. B1]KAI6103428.1 hypothetical protein F5141DRAFT_207568 [Pisolithus sp. B1]
MLFIIPLSSVYTTRRLGKAFLCLSFFLPSWTCNTHCIFLLRIIAIISVFCFRFYALVSLNVHSLCSISFFAFSRHPRTHSRFHLSTRLCLTSPPCAALPATVILFALQQSWTRLSSHITTFPNVDSPHRGSLTLHSIYSIEDKRETSI